MLLACVDGYVSHAFDRRGDVIRHGTPLRYFAFAGDQLGVP